MMQTVYGRGREGTAEVTVGESDIGVREADVVAPATTNESVSDLLGGRSIESVDDAEQTVLEWLTASVPENN